MVFSSNMFVFGVAPAFFIVYYLLPRGAARNGWLLLFSLAFYAFGTGPIVYVLIVSILINYVAARLMDEPIRGRTAVFATAVALNVAMLAYYKYAGFMWSVANDALGGSLARIIPRPSIELPIGISFFTFQAISYIADVYTRHTRAAPSLLNFSMYHSLFPQLIAGPIVRYAEIRSEITERTIGSEMLARGMLRFVIGLAKKVIIADNVGIVADQVFKLTADQLTPATAWIGVIAYTVQILFDFSGYSDMAIGLGLMLGFHFPENFNDPYTSRSITEFWRRWHMTLSRWFRDYVYIPLGGNRQGPARTYANLLIVFFLCGLWHGAGYTFIVWGLFHGGLLIAERLVHNRFGIWPTGLAGRVYALLMIMVGWVVFRSGTMTQAVDMLRSMAFLKPRFATPQAVALAQLLPSDKATYLTIGVLLALFPLRWSWWDQHPSWFKIAVARAAAACLFIFAAAQMSSGTFNPFIYFRF